MDTASLYAERMKHILDACYVIQHVKQRNQIHGCIIDVFIIPPDIAVSNFRIGDCLSDLFFYFLTHQFPGYT
jgi:glycine cleavage system protein P-like pyridoxal-binding family